MTSAVSRDMSVQMVKPVSGKNNHEQTDNMIAFADSMQQATQTGAENMAFAAKGQGTADLQDAFEQAGKAGIDRLEENAKDTKPVRDEKQTEQAVKDKTDELKKKVAEELDVSEEEVEAAMEQLGLSWADLMQNGNMALLVGELTGIDGMAALTDEAAFAQIEGLADLVEEGIAELDMDAESLGGILAQMEAAEDAAGPVVEIVDDRSEEDRLVQPFDVNSLSEHTDANAAMTEVVTATDKSEKKENHAALNQNDQPMAEMNQPQAEAVAPTGETFVSEMGESVRAQEIIDQIADYVKVHHSQQITEMEIQLNPASLGNVHLQIASKDGVISAQLMAQDEAVRAALDSQLQQLKESLEAQGLKVSEVEVTVASHQFEENLDQQGREAEEQAMEQSKRSSRRILNLDQMDEDGELIDGEPLDEAERLQVEMMRMGGNKLNFRV